MNPRSLPSSLIYLDNDGSIIEKSDSFSINVTATKVFSSKPLITNGKIIERDPFWRERFPCNPLTEPFGL